MRNALLLPLLVFALTSCAAVTQQEWHTLAQGDVGVIVTYGVNGSEPRFDSVQTGVAVAINPWKQAWVEYPGGQQTLSMVRAEKEGKVQGDDSVQCHDKNGVQVNWDVSVVWRVDPAHVGELYVLQPKRPLSGAPGNDIEDLIVRRIARNVVPIACGLQTYIETYTGPGKQKLQQDVTRLMQDDAAKEFIKVDGVFPG